jgi:hypothetical protein
MPNISGVSRPAYVYDQANNQWVPIGVGPHTHSLADLPAVVSTAGGSTIVNQAATVKPLVIQGAAGQSTNLFEILNSAGTVMTSVSNGGTLYTAGPVFTNTVSLSSYGQIVSQNTNTGISVSGGTGYPNGGTIVYRGDTGGAGGTATNGLEFLTGSTEKMRLDSTGRLSLGATPYARINAGNLTYDFVNPGNWLTGAITTSGSYGGPISMLDGSAGFNFRLQDSGANLRISSGTTTSGLTDRLKIRNDNVLEVYGTVYSPRSTYGNTQVNNVAFAADGTGMASGTYNYILNASNNVSTKLVVFVNGSTRTDDNGTDSVTIRNDGGRLYLGNAAFQTYTYNPNSISDKTLKENIVDYTDGLEIIKSLEPKQFNFIGNDRTQYGFVAQDITDDKLVTEGADGHPWAVDYNGIISALTLAVKELSAEVDALKAKLAE